MSGYILCEVPRAKEPYYIESISTNIYSIEELCYYFHHSVYLLDDTILNETLCCWLRDALGLKKLYQKIKGTAEKNHPGIREYVYPVFKEINYLSYEDMKAYDNLVTALEKEPALLRMKRKGDCLVESRMYVNALKVYQELIQKCQKELSAPETELEIKEGFLGSLYHNVGCVYSYLFQKEEALEYFEKAYDKLHTGSALQSYLFAYYNAKSKKEYQQKLDEMQVDTQTRKEIRDAIDSVMKDKGQHISNSQIDGLLEAMIRDYHRSTGA